MVAHAPKLKARKDVDAQFAPGRDRPPNRWQQRLNEECFARGVAPDALDVPTGLNKAAVMALWLVARANGAPRPRRLFYAVDRRAVADEATNSWSG